MAKHGTIREHSYLKTIESIEHDERFLCVVHQHPMGIIGLYILSLAGLAIALILTALLLPSYFGTTATTYSIFSVIAVSVCIFVFVVMAAATVVYRQSHLTVTDKNVIQVLQKGLFARTVSQISLSNIEDVTSEQRGLIANIFNYGQVKIETAGEQANFAFSYCPSPHRVSKIILEAKNDFLSRTGQTGSVRNRMS